MNFLLKQKTKFLKVRNQHHFPLKVFMVLAKPAKAKEVIALPDFSILSESFSSSSVPTA